MKLKAVERLCKRKKTIEILTDPDRKTQWIGDGISCYLLPAGSDYTSGMFLTMFDVPDSKIEDYNLIDGYIPTAINIDPTDPSELLLNIETDIGIYAYGSPVVMVKTSMGIAGLDARNMSPFTGIEEISWFERIGARGNLYFVAKLGFIVVGVVPPMKIDTEAAAKLISWGREIERFAERPSGPPEPEQLSI